MKKDTKQRLFEIMRRINPDFVLNEASESQQTFYTPIELEILDRMARNITTNGYVIQNPLTYDIIYNYNQKHGNVIDFPLVNHSKDETIERITEFLYSIFATDEQVSQLKTLNYEQLTEFLQSQFQDYEKNLRQKIEDNIKQHSQTLKTKAITQQSGNDWYEPLIKSRLQQAKREFDELMRELEQSYKYPNAVASRSINFYELYPVARPITESDWKTVRYNSKQVVEATKSLVRKGAIIVIPFTEQEKVEMDKLLYRGNLDYLSPNWNYVNDGFAHIVLLKNAHEIMQMYDEYQTANFKFTKESLDDLFITALEGGTNYWAAFDLKGIPSKNVDPRPISEKVIDAVWVYKKSIPVYDLESGDIDLTSPWVRVSPEEYHDRTEDFFLKHGFEKLGDLNIDGVLNAISILKKNEKYSHILQSIATENYDAGDADVFFQLAIMGEVVFG